MASFVFDQALSFCLQDLQKLKFFSPKVDGYKEGVIMIKMNDAISQRNCVINIGVSVKEGNSFLKINFLINENPVEQRFELIKSSTVPPKGFKLMIVCPHTQAKCLKLYFDGSDFKTRKAIKGLYKIQTIKFGHKRSFLNIITKNSKLRMITALMQKPYSKPFYRGKLTKKNKRVIKAKWKLEKATSTGTL